MARKRPTIECVMCGQRGPSSNEDVIAKWLARKVVAKRAEPYFDLIIEMDDPGQSTTRLRKRGGLPLPYKLPEVCEGCNNGWMSNLEEGMKHASGRLVEGRPHLLHPYDQAVIATWMTKTALLYDIARGDRKIAPRKAATASIRRVYRYRAHRSSSARSNCPTTTSSFPTGASSTS